MGAYKYVSLSSPVLMYIRVVIRIHNRQCFLSMLVYTRCLLACHPLLNLTGTLLVTLKSNSSKESQKNVPGTSILSRDNNDLLLQLSWTNILFTSPSLRDPGLPRGQLSPLSNASPRTRRWFHLFLDSCHHHPPAQLLSYPPISYNATPWSTSRVAFRAIPSF